MKKFLDEFEREHSRVRANVMAAMGNVMPQHLLDPRLRGGPAMEPRGNDPWIDDEDCGEAPERSERVPLGPAQAASR